MPVASCGATPDKIGWTADAGRHTDHWKWVGVRISPRAQLGTVREDYQPGRHRVGLLPHDTTRAAGHAALPVGGEDGASVASVIGGSISASVFALVERHDAILKERLFRIDEQARATTART